MVRFLSKVMKLSIFVTLEMFAPASGLDFLCDDDGLLSQPFQHAVDEVLGCSSGSTAEYRDEFSRIKRSIETTWRTMPKDAHSRVDWRSVRYLAHRHLHKQSGLVVKGLEPSQLVNGTAAIFSQEIPDFAERLFGHEREAGGYSIDDTTLFISALERMLYETESSLLERAYESVSLRTHQRISKYQLGRAIVSFMKHWFLASDPAILQEVHDDESVMVEVIPEWHKVKSFVLGRVEALSFERYRQPRSATGRNLMYNLYSFGDAMKVIEGLTQSFQSFWSPECTTMKKQLLDMDKEGIGRVRLVDFYGTGSEQDWRFGESELYLRRLGVLDESSASRGMQVMIPNYMYGASNCAITAQHYLVCCRNECEDIMIDIEDEVEAPDATPEVLLAAVVASLGKSVGSDLEELLGRVASASPRGRVPLHGRLFAQWLHYAFPHTCPYPHKAGLFDGHTLTITDLGEDLGLATEQEMTKWQAIGREERRFSVSQLEKLKSESWIMQWDSEEELFVDYARNGRSGRRGKFRRRETAMLSIGIAALSLLVLLVIISISETRQVLVSMRAQHGRRHLV